MVRYNALKGLYETEKTIGCGGFAKVKLATHLATGEKVAIKIMDKDVLGDDLHRVKLELEALKTLSHDNICQLYQVIETESHFFIVMEYCSGGELFDHIVEKNRLTESESRMSFRQIVSAVAYLHSLGYAHRDLKPENVLLDKHQNLKLIDFGLCAKPEGGMESPLFTSCGSPTYAAPELILGQQYLGQEVDVWAMGVLLYALLAGSLPFDDLNIDNLYRKILNGKYEEPPFISKESRKLIRSMLQVEPTKRIKISDLLNHPWLTLGVLDPVEYRPLYTSTLDQECVQCNIQKYLDLLIEMYASQIGNLQFIDSASLVLRTIAATVLAKFMEIDQKLMSNELLKWKYDYNTATYYLMLSRKKRGLGLKLNFVHGLKILKSNEQSATPLLELPVNTANNHLTPNQKVRIRRKFNIATSPGYLSPISRAEVQDMSSPSGQFLEPKPAASDGGRKALKRPRSPFLDEASPVPSKKATPGKGTPSRTPDRGKLHNGTVETPGSARRMLGSIERSLHKVRHVLTPKKPLDSVSAGPAVLNSKDLCNVSTTQCRDPELVISELTKGLEKTGIKCTRKGFTLKGSLEPNVLNRFGGCSFELEICHLPNLGLPTLAAQKMTPTKSILTKGIFQNDTDNTRDLVGEYKNAMEKIPNIPGDENTKGLIGIRRKRLKGDSWCYKKVCEQVLALTCTGFNINVRGGLLVSSV